MSTVEGSLEIAVIESLLCNSSFNVESNWAAFLSRYLFFYIPVSPSYALRKRYKCITFEFFSTKDMIPPPNLELSQHSLSQ